MTTDRFSGSTLGSKGSPEIDYQHAGCSNVTESTPLLVSTCHEPPSTYPEGNRIPLFFEEVWRLSRYAFPVFISQLLEYSLVIVEVVSVGHLSTTALAAMSLGLMTAGVTGLSIIQGLTSALDTLLPSAYTSPQPKLVGLWTQRMFVLTCLTYLPILCVWLNAERILLALKQEPEVAKLSALYLRWLSFTLPAYGFNCIARRYFQSQGLFSVQTHILFIVAPCNLLLNYLLVWGPDSIRLGFIGAPIATAISSTLVSIFSLLYGIYFIPHTAWHPITSKMFTNLGLLVPLGLGGIGQTASEWWAWELVALGASFLGPVSLAAQSVLLTSSSTTFQISYAISNATAMRVGNLLGERNAKGAALAAAASLATSFIASFFISTTYLTFRHSWAYMFSEDPVVAGLVASVIPLIALFQVADGASAVISGILRASGQQVAGALLNLGGYYVIGLPLGVFLAFRHNMGLNGLWAGLAAALTFSAITGAILCFRTDWDREIEKVAERIASEDKLRKVVTREADCLDTEP